jgi:hypothetical protein
MATITDPVLSRLRAALDEVYGDRIERVVLFGSEGNPVTGRIERYGQSIMAKDVDKEEATAFLRDIGEWVMENYGRPLPDPEKYRRWLASAPLKNEAYDEDI